MKKKYDIGGIVNPIAQYSSIGSMFGPYGTLIGAGVGAGVGAYNTMQDEKMQIEYNNNLLQERKKKDAVRFNNLNDFSVPYMEYGGSIKYDNGGPVGGGDPELDIVKKKKEWENRKEKYQEEKNLYQSNLSTWKNADKRNTDFIEAEKKRLNGTETTIKKISPLDEFFVRKDKGSFYGLGELEKPNKEGWAYVTPFYFDNKDLKDSRYFVNTPSGRAESGYYEYKYLTFPKISKPKEPMEPEDFKYEVAPLQNKKPNIEIAKGNNDIIKKEKWVEVQPTRDFQKVKGKHPKTGKPYVAGFTHPLTKRFTLLDNDEYQRFLKNGNKVQIFEQGGVADYSNAEIEDGEMLRVPNFSKPYYMDGGTLEQLSSNGYLAEGNTHSEGGIDTTLPQGTQIYSDKLLSPRGKTFAEEAKELEKMKGKIEKGSDLTRVKKDSLTRIEERLSSLFNEQESMKKKESNNYAEGGTIPMKFPFSVSRGNEELLYNPVDYGLTYTPKEEKNINYGMLVNKAAPYISPLVQGLETLERPEYLPQRRIDEGILDTLPSDRDAELMTRSGKARTREGLNTAFRSIDNTTGSPSSNANKAYMFADWLRNTGDLASNEASMKANFKNNRFNNLLNIRNNNMQQGRIEDENRLGTNANRRNIRRAALTNSTNIMQEQQRDKIMLAAALSIASPEVRQNYMKDFEELLNYGG